EVALAHVDRQPRQRAAVAVRARQHADAGALAQKLADHVRADEARAAGDQGVYCSGGHEVALGRGWPETDAAWLRHARTFPEITPEPSRRSRPNLPGDHARTFREITPEPSGRFGRWSS